MNRFEQLNLNVNKVHLSEAEVALSEFDIIINTTPAGMNTNQEIPISLKNLEPDKLISDIVYVPFKTPILQQAEAQGNPVYNGLDMFIDRKSTRLNSSHVSISYASFRLLQKSDMQLM